ncbi:hypothetical protein FBU30_009724 [Linnemannia zychae]|nr:hypothetical protein FBU30_009724 [Linnemannia zychae]
MSIIASVAVRSDTLYLYYTTTNQTQGSLYAISSNNSSSSSFSAASSAALPSTFNNFNSASAIFAEHNYKQDSYSQYGRIQTVADDTISSAAAPSSANTLYIQRQTINSASFNDIPRETLTGISLASTSSYDDSLGDYRHDLLLAYNYQNTASVFVKLVPHTPSPGNGLQPTTAKSGSPWWLSIVQGDLTPANSVVQLRHAPSMPITSSNPSILGSHIYQLFTTDSGWTRVRKFDVSSSASVKQLGETFYTDIRPGSRVSIIYLTMPNNVQNYDMAVLNPSWDNSGTNVLVSTPEPSRASNFTISGKFDVNDCFTNGNGLIIKITQSAIYTNNLGDYRSVSQWTAQQRPGSIPLPSPVLACATNGNTLYAVLEGPVIYTAQINNWIWQETSLVNFPQETITEDKKAFPKGAIAGIAVAVVIILGGVLFWLLWRRKRLGLGLFSSRKKLAEKGTLGPLPPSFTGRESQPGSIMQYSPVFSENSPTMVNSTTVNITPPITTYQSLPASTANLNPIPSTGWASAYHPATSNRDLIPMVSTSHLNAPQLATVPESPLNNNSFLGYAPSIPTTPNYAPTGPIVGDKEELTNEDVYGNIIVWTLAKRNNK